MTKPKKNQNDWVPYTMLLPDGRTVFVRIPGQYVTYDRSGEMAIKPNGVKFLENIKALAMQTPESPSPSYIRQVRIALKMTQVEFAEKLGYSVISVKKWEAGDVKLGKNAVDRLSKLVDRFTKRGLVMAG
ncbi:MAG TPA: hypothetical protein DCM28_15010 [Phycisphaerales bacterium]|nr:hypothetical protein [Phycisphaerales bacterium]|tara:strand:+ start:933 stop:1322 length:390 start_codon:yes stop_codon:yes gene_type:complete